MKNACRTLHAIKATIDSSINLIVYINTSQLSAQEVSEVYATVPDSLRDIVQAEMRTRDFVRDLDGVTSASADACDYDSDEDSLLIEPHFFRAPILVLPVTSLPRDALVEIEVVSLVTDARTGYCPEIFYDSKSALSLNGTNGYSSSVDILSWPIFGGLPPVPTCISATYLERKAIEDTLCTYELSTQVAHHPQLFLSAVTTMSSNDPSVSFDIAGMTNMLKVYKLHMLDLLQNSSIDVRTVLGIKIWLFSGLSDHEYADYVIAAKNAFSGIDSVSLFVVSAISRHDHEIEAEGNITTSTSFRGVQLKVNFLAIDLFQMRTESWVRGS